MVATILDHIKVRSPAIEAYTPSVEMAVEALHRFFSANTTNTLRVQYAYKSGLAQLPIGQKPQKLVVRHEFSTGRAYASARDFKQFIVAEGYPYADVVGHLRQVGVLKNDKRWITLGAGTEYVSAQICCVELDVTNPAVAGLITHPGGDAGGGAEPGHGTVVPISRARERGDAPATGTERG